MLRPGPESGGDNYAIGKEVVDLDRYDICRRSLDIERSPRPSPDPAIHIVFVAQTSCPTCVINGVDSLSREACFPYVDAALLQPRYGATPVC